MEDRQELISTSAESGRTAIIEVAGQALWLYLTEPGSTAIVSDCWLANVQPNGRNLTEEERATLRGAGLPPPAPPGALRDAANQPPIHVSAYTLDWSKDGEAVRALVDHQPVAFMVASEKRGFHRNIGAECPWGHVFDDELHERLFGQS